MKNKIIKDKDIDTALQWTRETKESISKEDYNELIAIIELTMSTIRGKKIDSVSALIINLLMCLDVASIHRVMEFIDNMLPVKLGEEFGEFISGNPDFGLDDLSNDETTNDDEDRD